MKDMFSNPIRDNLTEQEVWRLTVEHWQDVKLLILSLSHDEFISRFCKTKLNPIKFVKRDVLKEWAKQDKITQEQYRFLCTGPECFLCAYNYDCSPCPLQVCNDDYSIWNDICDAANEYSHIPKATPYKLFSAINKLIETVQKSLKTRYIE